MENKRNLVKTIGSKGGILVMWDKRSWKGEMVEYGNQSITCKLCEVNRELTWFLLAVYASCDRNERMDLWEDLGAMRRLCEGPWVVSGDFNTTRFPPRKPTVSGFLEP
ncbi:hypothetical protein H5410_002271 [Solanum commersonii]|uniref:Uncharacterized protein n=1 Tax=Solanum commersonii TaxID=4109 RepID=A0A9J6B1W0_SOLCO|nr:hypothetical protein H5410_002271 [Solanum commersonii]